jgi:hypothetical protein
LRLVYIFEGNTEDQLPSRCWSREPSTVRYPFFTMKVAGYHVNVFVHRELSIILWVFCSD